MAVAWARPAVWCWAGMVLLPLGYSPPENPRCVPLPRSFRATIPDVPLGVLGVVPGGVALLEAGLVPLPPPQPADRKSTRLNSSHTVISYAVFCLKKKNRA